MNIKSKLERACFRAVGMSIVLMTVGVAPGAVLWTNGPATFAQPTACDSLCGNTSGPIYTVFDNFTVGPNNWQVNSFSYSDFFVTPSTGYSYNDFVSYTATAQYTSTLWSIWSGDPLAGGKVIASGTAVASLGTPDCTLGLNMCLVKMSISGLSVTLSSGTTYYIGIANVETSGAMTMRALSTGSNLPGYEASNGGSPTTPPSVGSTWVSGTDNPIFTGSDSAFDISGNVVTPEPGTLTFMGLTLGALWLGRRRLCK